MSKEMKDPKTKELKEAFDKLSLSDDQLTLVYDYLKHFYV